MIKKTPSVRIARATAQAGFLALAFGIFSVSAVFAGGGGGGYSGGDSFVFPVPPGALPPEVGNNTTTVTATITTAAAGAVADTYTENWQVMGDFMYAWNRWGGSGNVQIPSSDTSINGYASALSNPNITVGHSFGIYDHTTHAPIGQNGNVSVGQVLDLTFNPITDHEISWFGTGYSLDSPYGHWDATAAPPPRISKHVTCSADDYVQNSNVSGYSFDTYVPLMVIPPARSITGTTGMSCGSLTTAGDGSATMTCTVQSAAPINPIFHFAATTGKFYYRYYDYRDMGSSQGGPGCYGNNIPLSVYTGLNPGSTIQAPFVLTVPPMDVTYPLNSGVSNNNPTAPSITCPASVQAGDTASFTISGGVDPDGDQIRYGIDWAKTGSVNEWVPPSGYVQSGSSQTVTHVWNTAGTYTVQALTQDSKGGNSNTNTSISSTDHHPYVCSGAQIGSSTSDEGLTAYPDWTDGGAPQPPSGFDAHPENYCFEIDRQSVADNDHAPGDVKFIYTYSWHTGAGLTQKDVNGSPCLAGTGTGGVKFPNDCKPISQTFALTSSGGVTGPNGSGWVSCDVPVTASPTAPTALLTNNGPVVAGTKATLTWSCSGGQVNSATIDGGIGAVSPATGGSVQTGVINADTTYHLTCTGPYGSTTDQTTVSTAAPIVASCQVTPSSGDFSTNFTWKVTSVTGGTGVYTYSWTGENLGGHTGNSATVSYVTAGNKTGSVTITSGANSITTQCLTTTGQSFVTVASSPLVLLTATPSTIVSGASSLLTWSSQNATSCTGAPTDFAKGATSNLVGTPVSPSADTAYTITCTDANGRQGTSSALVSVVAGNLSVTATPSSVRKGETSTITWSAVGQKLTSCSIAGPGLSSTLFSGSSPQTINSESTYTLSCLAGTLQSKASATVKIIPGFKEI